VCLGNVCFELFSVIKIGCEDVVFVKGCFDVVCFKDALFNGKDEI